MIEFALGADGAAMGKDDVFGNGEPQAGAARFAGAGSIHPVEAFKQASQVLGRNARAEILNVELDSLWYRPSSQDNAATLSGIFQSIVHQI